ncbi:conserved exported protein of unknown function [Rhodovastum atsumiense]|uniref:Uncharacterized protein n=1 Tax=Rhodovastum atsumiense TaxID=504468 RepID=A0A5M6IRU7_9PROT|nr:hypothetical protein [Rhodovastum atsumiense]KAA5610994.1 hypothetical protein F1189_16415 [Rhodovastum atsumiense]CAH2600226.1 conserved exported protein of unknown function [Rhodovastum atsumiense]
MKPGGLLPVTLLALALPLSAGADPQSGPSLSQPAQPLQQVQPLQTLKDYTPAPVPNIDFDRTPLDKLTDRPRTELSPSLFNHRDRRKGEGYLPGSAAEYDPNETRGFRPSPGINLKVPLQ